MAKTKTQTQKDDETQQTNFRLRKSTIKILDRLCNVLVADPILRVSKAQVVELAIREFAKNRGIP